MTAIITDFDDLIASLNRRFALKCGSWHLWRSTPSSRSTASSGCLSGRLPPAPTRHALRLRRLMRQLDNELGHGLADSRSAPRCDERLRQGAQQRRPEANSRCAQALEQSARRACGRARTIGTHTRTSGARLLQRTAFPSGSAHAARRCWNTIDNIDAITVIAFALLAHHRRLFRRGSFTRSHVVKRNRSARCAMRCAA